MALLLKFAGANKSALGVRFNSSLLRGVNGLTTGRQQEVALAATETFTFRPRCLPSARSASAVSILATAHLC